METCHLQAVFEKENEMTTKAAREFWIEEKRMCTTAWAAHTIKSNPPHEQFKECFIHVIEYSAYGELKRQNEVMREALEEIANQKISGSLVYDASELMIETAKEALSKCGKGGSV